VPSALHPWHDVTGPANKRFIISRPAQRGVLKRLLLATFNTPCKLIDSQ